MKKALTSMAQHGGRYVHLTSPLGGSRKENIMFDYIERGLYGAEIDTLAWAIFDKVRDYQRNGKP